MASKVRKEGPNKQVNLQNNNSEINQNGNHFERADCSGNSTVEDCSALWLYSIGTIGSF